MPAGNRVRGQHQGHASLAVILLGGAFFLLDFDPRSAVLGSATVLGLTSRAAGSGPWPLARFSGSILDFLTTFGCLRLRAKSTDEAGLASGFCKPFACGQKLRVPC